MRNEKAFLGFLLFIICALFFAGCDNPIVTGILPSLPKTLSGSVLITGNNWVGETLTADTSFLEGSGTISYQWRRGSTGVGTNSAAYVIETADVGGNITVTVSRSENKGTVTSNAIKAIFQPLSTGTIPIIGVNKIGETLKVDTSVLSGGSGTFSYQWQADGVDIAGETGFSYTIKGSDVGKVILCEITRDDAIGVLSTQALKVPYTIVIDIRNAASGDFLTASRDSGDDGDTITLNYTVAHAAFYNELTFGGINSAVIAAVSASGNAARMYTVNVADASNGVITIIATFTHTDLISDPITFSNPAGLIAATYGDTFSNAATSAHSGAISYSSSDNNVAAVNGSGVVSILKTGTIIITAEKAADAVYAYASRSYTLSINPRPVTVTPDALQSKVFGTADPVFTYTANEPLIAGNSFSGALSRIPGENVGTYNFALGTLTAGDNYSLTLGGGAAFEITKAPGAAVGGVPVLSGVSAPGNITINAVNIPLNPGSQAVEYAISQSDDGNNLSAWQAGMAFSGLSAGTDYYVYARSAENANYNAGAYSVSAAILFYSLTFDANGAGGTVPLALAVLPGTVVTLPAKGNLAQSGFSFGCWNTNAGGTGDNYVQGQTYTVTGNKTLYARWMADQKYQFPVTLPTGGVPISSGITISQTGNGYPLTASMAVPGGSYISAEWYYGSILLGNGLTLVLDVMNFLYNVPGTHNITLVVEKDGAPYNFTITFNVVP